MSTGVIGEMLPLEKIRSGIELASKELRADADALECAARGMMTTDTVSEDSRPRGNHRGRADSHGRHRQGRRHDRPQYVDDARADHDRRGTLTAKDAQTALVDAVEDSFNCISVDGHMSTNDTVLLLANGAAGGPVLEGKALACFRATLDEVCEDLAQSIPADGEGATHLITVEVHGCKTAQDARQIGKTIADSPLVKTAIAGADPNWGRIVSAAGYAGIRFDPAKVTLHLNGLLLYERGAPVDFDGQAVSDSIAADRDTSIVLLLEEGTAAARFWTTDLTAEYVRLNAEYHT